MIKDLILNNSSYRRFYQDVPISSNTLEELIDLLRHLASGADLQPLTYILSCYSDNNDLIFPHLARAGCLKDWDGPTEGDRPPCRPGCLKHENEGGAKRNDLKIQVPPNHTRFL